MLEDASTSSSSRLPILSGHGITNSLHFTSIVANFGATGAGEALKGPPPDWIDGEPPEAIRQFLYAISFANPRVPT